MKTIFSRVLLPVAAITLSIAGAVGTNAMTKSAKVVVDKWGYLHNTTNPAQPPCQLSTVMCTDVINPNICETSSGADLYDFASTVSCPNPLYRRITTP